MPAAEVTSGMMIQLLAGSKIIEARAQRGVGRLLIAAEAVPNVLRVKRNKCVLRRFKDAIGVPKGAKAL